MTPQDGSPLQGKGVAKKFGAEGFVNTDQLLDAIRVAERRKERLDLLFLSFMILGFVATGAGVFLLFGLAVTLITLGVFVMAISYFASVKNNTDGNTDSKKG